MKKKKIITVCLVVALVAVFAIGGYVIVIYMKGEECT